MKCAVVKTIAFQKANPDKIVGYEKRKVYHAAYREGHKEKRTLQLAQWRGANKDKHRASIKKWKSENKDRACVSAALRRTRELQGMLSFTNEEAIREIYRECRRISEETGVVHHVDHIVPLAGKSVCGLHVPCNLQVIPAYENLRKGNHYWPDKVEGFI